MKSSASESKPFQSRSKGEIPGRARRKEWLSHSKLKQAFLIDSDAELFMKLTIQRIRFSAWKVRHLKGLIVLTTRKKLNYNTYKIVFHLHGFVSLTQLKLDGGRKIIMLYVKNNIILLKIMNEVNLEGNTFKTKKY